ncbi:YGGT family protein [Clostridium puniceum]|uniref:YGGT family protein n=1 Tax=Clostridium puniceum TaxID=29367 RepID=A0A1S8TTQ0_9CLOT|nr:YggT family protein [Clostridium puniceum]OOM81029.1 YGGT family protein [Clostridium puniceum]
MIINIIITLFNLLELAILLEVIISWIPQIRDNKVVSTIHNFVYPMMEPLKTLQDRLIPGLPIDFSPIIAIFILDVLKKLLLGILF